MVDHEPMSEGTLEEGSEGEDGFGMSDNEDGGYPVAAAFSSDESQSDFDDEDDSDDVLEGLDVLDGPMRRVGMDSDSDIEYGREGYFYPFDNDLILSSEHRRERYGSSTSYKLSVPRSGNRNGWVRLFSAALSGKVDAVQRDLRQTSDFGQPESLSPPHRDFPLAPCTPAATLELQKNIGHHLCDSRCVPTWWFCSSTSPCVDVTL